MIATSGANTTGLEDKERGWLLASKQSNQVILQSNRLEEDAFLEYKYKAGLPRERGLPHTVVLAFDRAWNFCLSIYFLKFLTLQIFEN